MTFLKKLGSVLAQGIAVITGIFPLVAPFFGSSATTVQTVNTVKDDFTSIGQVVVSAEALLTGTGTGPAKLAAATPLVANIIRTSELVSGHKIANEAAFTKACEEITGGVADLLNSLDPGTVQTAGKPLPIGPAPSAPVTA